MNRSNYRQAFDEAGFSPDFQQKTLARLAQEAGRTDEKERLPMRAKTTRRTVILVCALAAALMVTAAAAVRLLGPGEVAQVVGDPALAAAFAQDGAILIDETVESEGYQITLSGLVNGAGLSSFCQDVDEDRTYAVLAVRSTDGSPLTYEDVSSLSITPLVEGYAPWQLSAWQLGGGFTSFAQDGVVYYLFDCQSVEPFADRTVYLAAFEGFPSAEIFTMAEDGSISFTEQMESGFITFPDLDDESVFFVSEGGDGAVSANQSPTRPAGPHALFTLPLDPAKADPDAAARILADCGLMP